MRVLFTGHTGLISGGERCLLDLFNGGGVGIEPHYAGPAGPMLDAVRALGVPCSPLRGTAVSLRVGRSTPAEIVDLARGGLDVVRIARRIGAEVVLANSMRAGLMSVLAARLTPSVPHVVYIHDVLPSGAAGTIINALIRRGTTRAIANSRYSARRFAPDGIDVDVVYNPIDLRRFDPDAWSKPEARQLLDLPVGAPLIGLISQITPWKGQLDAIEAHAILREEYPEARLLLGGTPIFNDPGTRYDNQAYLVRLREAAARVGGDDVISFLGERTDVPLLLRALDVLVMPSWEEPFGRIAVEAMAMGTAVVATNVGGPPEYVADGATGLLVAPRDPAALARAVSRLLGDDVLRTRIATAGQGTVRQRFGHDQVARKVIASLELAITATRR
jgi:glycosyltransferase involved in cell wall biosynthesis